MLAITNKTAQNRQYSIQSVSVEEEEEENEEEEEENSDTDTSVGVTADAVNCSAGFLFTQIQSV